MDALGMFDGDASPMGASVAAILGIKGSLRFRPHGSSQKAHVVLRRVTLSDDSSDDGEIRTVVRFSLFAQKRIEVKPGKEILLTVSSEDERFNDQPIVFEGDLQEQQIGDEEEEETQVADEEEEEELVLPAKQIIPPKMRRDWTKKVDEVSPTIHTCPTYTSVGVQAEPSCPSIAIQAQPIYSSASMQTEFPSSSVAVQVGVPPLPRFSSGVQAPDSDRYISSDVQTENILIQENESCGFLPEQEKSDCMEIDQRVERSLSPMELESPRSSSPASPILSPLYSPSPIFLPIFTPSADKVGLTALSRASSIASSSGVQDMAMSPSPVPFLVENLISKEPHTSSKPISSLSSNPEVHSLVPLCAPSYPAWSPKPTAVLCPVNNGTTNPCSESLVHPNNASAGSQPDLNATPKVFKKTEIHNPFVAAKHPTGPKATIQDKLEGEQLVDKVYLKEPEVTPSSSSPKHPIPASHPSPSSTTLPPQVAPGPTAPEKLALQSTKNPGQQNAVASGSKLPLEGTNHTHTHSNIPVGPRTLLGLSSRAQEKSPVNSMLKPSPLTKVLQGQNIRKSPPPDPKALAYIHSGPSSNPLGIRPAAMSMLHKKPPSAPKVMLQPAKKRVVVGAGWSAARGANGMSNSSTSLVTPSSASSSSPSLTSSPAAQTALNYAPPAKPMDLGSIIEYNSPSPPPAPLDPPPLPPPLPPANKWKKVGNEAPPVAPVTQLPKTQPEPPRTVSASVADSTTSKCSPTTPAPVADSTTSERSRPVPVPAPASRSPPPGVVASPSTSFVRSLPPHLALASRTKDQISSKPSLSSSRAPQFVPAKQNTLALSEPLPVSVPADPSVHSTKETLSKEAPAKKKQADQTLSNGISLKEQKSDVNFTVPSATLVPNTSSDGYKRGPLPQIPKDPAPPPSVSADASLKSSSQPAPAAETSSKSSSSRPAPVVEPSSKSSSSRPVTALEPSSKSSLSRSTPAAEPSSKSSSRPTPAVEPSSKSSSRPTPTVEPSSKSSTARPAPATQLVTAAKSTPASVPQPLNHPLPPKPCSAAAQRRGVKRERPASPENYENERERRRRRKTYRWPTVDSNLTMKLQGEGDLSVRSISFASDGSHFAIACADRTIRIWNNRTRVEIARLSHNSSVVSALWMEDDAGVIALSEDGLVSKWTRSGQNFWHWAKILDAGTEAPSDGEKPCFAYHQDRIAVAFPRSGVKIWMWLKGSWQIVRSINHPHVSCIRFVEGTNTIVGGTQDGTMLGCEVPNGILRAFSFTNSTITSIDVTSSGTHILVGQLSGAAKLIKLRTRDSNDTVEQSYTCKETEARPSRGFGAVFATKGQAILYGDVDGCSLVWDRKKGAVVYGLEHDEDDPVIALASFDAGKEGCLLTGSKCGQISWWSQPVAAVIAEDPNKRKKGGA